MGNEDYRGSPLLPNSVSLFLQGHACLRVDAGEWLVHQQDFGVVGQRPHDTDALLHAARKLGGISAGRVQTAGEGEIFVGDPVTLGLRHAAPVSSPKPTLSSTVFHGNRAKD